MFFKRSKENLEIEDDLFGKISFVRVQGDKNYWLGSAEIEREFIEVIIYGNENGIDKYQKEIFIEFENQYAQIKPTIEQFINSKVIEKEYSIKKDFSINHISIFSSKEREIEIVYDLNDDFCCFEVSLKDLKPIDLGISA